MPKRKPVNANVNPEELRRLTLLNDMTPATRKLAADFDQHLAREHHDGLMLRHAMGVTLGRVIGDERTYGSNAVEQLAKYLGMSPDRLYKLRTYANVFTRQQVEAWAARRTAKGGGIRYHHLAAVMVVESPEERLKLVERVFAESLSVRRLRDLIASADLEVRKRKRPGGEHAQLLDGLGRLIDGSRAMAKRLSGPRGLQLFDAVGRADPARVGPLLRNRVAMAQTVVDELATHLDDVRGRLAEAVAHVNAGGHTANEPAA